MKEMSRFLTALFLVLCASAVPALCCQCGVQFSRSEAKTMRELAISSVVDARKTAMAVFEGQVTAIAPKAFDPSYFINHLSDKDSPSRSVTFELAKIYKGQVKGEVVVQTGFGGGDCGLDFEAGKDYLVYAYRLENGQLETGMCTSTKLLEHAGPELRVWRGEAAKPEDLLSPDKYRRKMSAKWYGSLCGRVTDQFGGVLEGISVNLVRLREDTFFFDEEETQSTSDGSFCLNYLEPGQYRLGAISDATASARMIGYYPAGNKLADAAVIELAGGEKLQDYHVSLHSQLLHTVKLKVPRQGDAPLPPDLESVLLSPAINPFEYKGSSVNVDETGSVTFLSVPPGHYQWVVFQEPDSESALRWKALQQDIDVSDNSPVGDENDVPVE